MAGSPHHMNGVVDPRENYSVARYVQEAMAWVEDILRRGKQPILVGGTGLYIDGLCQGRTYSDFQPASGPAPSPQAGSSPRAGGAVAGAGAGGPRDSGQLHPHDEADPPCPGGVAHHRQAHLPAQPGEPGSPAPLKVAHRLTYRDQRVLYQHIDQRVDQMVARGLVGGPGPLGQGALDGTAMQAIGYKGLAGPHPREDLAQAVEVKRRSRQYAKRQLTWFRRDPNIEWILLEKDQDFSSVIQDSTNYLREKGLP